MSMLTGNYEGTIVQVLENGPDGWAGALVIVDEVRDWGIQAYMILPKQGAAYVRLAEDQYVPVGRAFLIT